MLEATNSGLHDVTISTSWMEEWIRTDTIRPHLTHYMSLSLSRNPSSCLRERCKTHNDPPRLTGVDRSGLFNKQLFEGLTENRSAIVMFKRSKFEIFWIWLWQICSCGVTNRTEIGCSCTPNVGGFAMQDLWLAKRVDFYGRCHVLAVSCMMYWGRFWLLQTGQTLREETVLELFIRIGVAGGGKSHP